MRRTMRGLLAAALLLLLTGLAQAQGDKAEMTDNPMYKFWAKFKPGATATLQEQTKLSGAEKESVPGGVDRKTITYLLLNVTKDRVVVGTVVTENDFLGTVQHAPTRITYLARIPKANLRAVLQEFGAKHTDDEMIKVAGKEIKCKVLAGTSKSGGATIEYRYCYSEEVPGGVVRRTRTTRDGDKVVAETTIVLRSFAEGKAKKKDDKK